MADGLVILLLSLVALLPAAASDINVLLVLAFVLIFFAQVPYFVLTQRRSGQSPGKRLLGLRVVDADGETPGTAALLRRSIPLLVEYLYVVALISMLSSPYRQRLGDRWGHTCVIDAREPPELPGSVLTPRD